MTRPVNLNIDRDQLIELRDAGKTMADIARLYGVGSSTILRLYRRLGVNARAIDDHATEIARRYSEDLVSILALSKEYAVPRIVIERILSEQKVSKRSPGEQQLIRNAALTPEQRKANATAAHAAKRGRPNPLESRIRGAATREASGQPGSLGERVMIEWLNVRGLPCIAQKAIVQYNVDIALPGSVAVEVFGGNWHSGGPHAAREPERAKEIMSRGWSLVYVWDQRRCPLVEAAADQVVTVHEIASVDPSPIGQYWVIRGDGEVLTRGRGELDHAAVELSQRRARR